ncbi:MAG TPA: sialidase family protein [Pyrinomonadaceae bacterium]|jgi:hypothetical protein
MKKINSQIKVFAVFCFLLLLSSCAPKTETNNNPAAQTSVEDADSIRVSALDTNAAEPAIAADASGNVYVVYVEHGADKSADIYLQKFDADAKSSGGRTRVNPEKGQVKAWFGDAPTIKIAADGCIFIGWTAKAAGAEKQGASVLNLSVSADGGKSFAAPVKVNDDVAPAAHGMHSLAIDRDNRVFMAWLDERNLKAEKTAFNRKNANSADFQIVEIHHHSNQDEKAEPNSEVFFAVSADGGKTFSANKKLSSEVCPCCKTSIINAPDGKIFVSWRQVLEGDFRHIAVAASADGGQTFANRTIVSDDKWTINACPVSGASMTSGEENSLKIVWYTAGEAGKPGLYYAESRDGGKTFSPRALISAETVTGTSTILNEPGKNARIVFSEANNQIVIGSAENSAGNFSVRQTINRATLPAAAFAGEKLFVAFVRESEEKQGVWLYREK